MPLTCTQCGCLFEGTHRCNLDDNQDEFQRGYNQGRLRCLQQHGLEKEVEETKLTTINEIRTMIAKLMQQYAETPLDQRKMNDGWTMLETLDLTIQKHFKL